jgi:uncharacterized repeat protein (TIGR04138 family)
MSMRHSGLAEIVRRDPRFSYEAYEFVFAALHHTQKRLGRLPKKGEKTEAPQTHVSGKQLLEGIQQLAIQEFGLMARTVFRCWGIRLTADFGDIVFNLIDANLMSKSPQDSREDFRTDYDLDEVLNKHYQIDLSELD